MVKEDVLSVIMAFVIIFAVASVGLFIGWSIATTVFTSSVRVLWVPVNP